MQLGARWVAGAQPHPSVPEALHPAIREQEALHAGASSWTLTWLEGRPRCDLAGLVLVTLDRSGAVVVSSIDGTDEHLDASLEELDDDDWLT